VLIASRATVRECRGKLIKKRLAAFMIKLVLLIALACLVSAVLRLPPLGFCIAIAVAFIAALIIAPVRGMLRRAPMLGRITRAEHDYYIGTTGVKGSGFSHSNLREQHKFAVTVEFPRKLESKAKKLRFYFSPKYEKVYRVGDVVLYCPGLSYLANVNNKYNCACMCCGSMQSAEHSICCNCSRELINITTCKAAPDAAYSSGIHAGADRCADNLQ